MKIKNLTKEQKESIKHLGILELFEGCGKNIFLKQEKNVRIGYDCGVEEFKLCPECRAKIQQAQKDFKRESEEVGEMIEFLEEHRVDVVIEYGESQNNNWFNKKLEELKSKQDALILASELEG